MAVPLSELGISSTPKSSEQRGKLIHLKPEEILYTPMHQADALFVVEKGAIVVYNNSLPSDKSKGDDHVNFIDTVAHPKGIVGTVALTDASQYDGTAIALMESEVKRYDMQEINEAVEEEPEFLFEMLEIISGQAKRQIEHYTSLTGWPAKEKIEKAEKDFERLQGEVKITQTLIGNRSGVRRETYNRELNRHYKVTRRNMRMATNSQQSSQTKK